MKIEYIVSILLILLCLGMINIDLRQVAAQGITGQNKMDSTTNTHTTKFALELTRKLASEYEKNIFICPFSIHACLQMAYSGAAGKTASQMANLLGIENLSVNQANKEYQNIVDTFTERSSSSKTRNTMDRSSNFSLEIANSAWVNKSYKLKSDYLNTLQSIFKAQCSNVDFSNPKTTQDINTWVNTKTHGKINNIIDSLNPLEMLVLINAAYFKARWEHGFSPDNTKIENFYSPKQTVKIPMMHVQGHFAYYEDKNVQIVSLPYNHCGCSMYVFLPKTNLGLSKFCLMLTPENWQHWLESMNNQSGVIALPKFKMHYFVPLKSILSSLGMVDAFTNAADFSKMVISPPPDEVSLTLHPSISEVLHKTFVDVNEEGTEAAAVTAVVMCTAMAPRPEPPFKMTVDHPFFFAIVDNNTNTILFTGTVTNITSV